MQCFVLKLSNSMPQFRMGESFGGTSLSCALQRECVELLERQFCESHRCTLRRTWVGI